MNTQRKLRWTWVVVITLVGGLGSAVVAQDRPLSVKVFILAGQSNMPVVIGELGLGGPAEAEKNDRMAQIRKAQKAPTYREEFAGTVAFVATSEYWDDTAHEILKKYWIRREWTDAEARERFETMGSQPPYHYLGSAKVYSSMGYGFAKAMLELPLP